MNKTLIAALIVLTGCQVKETVNINLKPVEPIKENITDVINEDTKEETKGVFRVIPYPGPRPHLRRIMDFDADGNTDKIIVQYMDGERIVYTRNNNFKEMSRLFKVSDKQLVYQVIHYHMEQHKVRTDQYKSGTNHAFFPFRGIGYVRAIDADHNNKAESLMIYQDLRKEKMYHILRDDMYPHFKFLFELGDAYLKIKAPKVKPKLEKEPSI